MLALVVHNLIWCNLTWNVWTSTSRRCEVMRDTPSCEMTVVCHTGQSYYDRRTGTSYSLSEEVRLNCRGNQREALLRVNDETWAVVTCRQ